MMSAHISPLIAYPQDPTNVKEALLQQYTGKHYKALPTPSVILRESTIDLNINQVLSSVDRINQSVSDKVLFRSHIKTHKAIEGVLKELGHGVEGYSGPLHDRIVVSTLREAYMILDYQEKNKVQVVKDIVYGLPAITSDILPELYKLAQRFDNFHIFVDNIEHIKIISEFNKGQGITYKWSAFVKVDMGTKRAGVSDKKYLQLLLKEIISNGEYIELFGFYAHAGHSYSKDSLEDNEQLLLDEINSVNDGCKALLEIFPKFDTKSLILSVGASPTARSFQKFRDLRLVDCINSLLATLELHAGNFMICDLQQLSTGTIEEDNQAAFILASVISCYSKRNNELGEMLINAGVLSFSKEQSSKFPGFGKLFHDSIYGNWIVDRLSQEHGILRPLDSQSNCTFAPIGEKVEVLIQHACITLACFRFYFIIDRDGIVKDVWVPCSGW